MSYSQVSSHIISQHDAASGCLLVYTIRSMIFWLHAFSSSSWWSISTNSVQYLRGLGSAICFSLGTSKRIPKILSSLLFSSSSASSFVSAHFSDSFSFVLSIFRPAILHQGGLFLYMLFIILHSPRAAAQLSISLDFCTNRMIFLHPINSSLNSLPASKYCILPLLPVART